MPMTTSFWAATNFGIAQRIKNPATTNREIRFVIFPSFDLNLRKIIGRSMLSPPLNFRSGFFQFLDRIASTLLPPKEFWERCSSCTKNPKKFQAKKHVRNPALAEKSGASESTFKKNLNVI
jgi:hypothetical protein